MRVLTVLVYQIYVCSHSVLKEDVSEFCNSVFYCASIIGKSKSKKQTILPKEKKKKEQSFFEGIIEYISKKLERDPL